VEDRNRKEISKYNIFKNLGNNSFDDLDSTEYEYNNIKSQLPTLKSEDKYFSSQQCDTDIK
jgi:hypothetical protein